MGQLEVGLEGHARFDARVICPNDAHERIAEEMPLADGRWYVLEGTQDEVCPVLQDLLRSARWDRSDLELDAPRSVTPSELPQQARDDRRAKEVDARHDERPPSLRARPRRFREHVGDCSDRLLDGWGQRLGDG